MASKPHFNITVHLNSCSDMVSVVQIALIGFIMLCSIIGNGLLCALLIRFKTLRTVPNILVVNLAVNDIINALVNMPLMILWYICKVDFLKGQAPSFFIISFYVFSMRLTVFSLVVLTMDRYGAIVHGIRYHTWKTRNKAIIAVVGAWLAAFLYTYGEFSTAIDIDVGDAPAMIYRSLYFRRFGRKFIIPMYAVPFTLILFMAVRMWRSAYASSIKIAPHCHAGTNRVKADVHTATTVCLTIVAYVLMGFLPVFLFSVAKIHGSWLHFMAYFFIHMNSMANPVIYSLRTRRFRMALVKLFKEPLGKSQPK